MSQLDSIVTPIAEPFARVRGMMGDAVLSGHDALGDVSRHLFSLRGKMMRPMLTLLSASMHGELNERSEKVAIMIELVHNATLVHDDVIDEAYIRHGEPTLGALLRSRSAVLAGDFLFSRGLSLASSIGAYQELDVTIEAIESLVEGELRQARSVRAMVVDRQEYFEIISLKTASLIVAAMKVGVISVGGSAEQVELMAQYGRQVGAIFQIQDDILDYTSSSTGKVRYNDIAERKITLPLLCAIESGGRGVLGDLRRGRVGRVAQFVADNQGVQAASAICAAMVDRAVELLESYGDLPEAESLRMMAKFAAGREF